MVAIANDTLRGDCCCGCWLWHGGAVLACLGETLMRAISFVANVRAAVGEEFNREAVNEVTARIVADSRDFVFVDGNVEMSGFLRGFLHGKGNSRICINRELSKSMDI